VPRPAVAEPVAPPPSEQPQPPAVPGEPERPSRIGGTILVCDDEPGVRAFVAAALEERGYHVIGAASSETALAILEADPEIDLLLVDFGMPGLNGAAVARRSQERRPGLPVLLISGDPERVKQIAEAKDLPILSKPFKQKELSARIAGMLGPA
jgi:DNA-binding response OmpR family regulator